MKKKIFFMMLGLLLITSACGKKNNSITTYKNGEAVYYNPVTNSKCSDYTEENSKSENKIGCMKWYIYSYNEEDDSVKLILDHNTSGVVPWMHYSKLFAVPFEESDIKKDLDILVNDYGWKVKPNIITAEEVAKITGIKDFNKDTSDIVYFKTKTDEEPYFGRDEVSEYAWLYNYLHFCKNDYVQSYGCSIDNDEEYTYDFETFFDSYDTYGYWTLTTDSIGEKAWIVQNNGALVKATIGHDSIGLRPVIEISKSILE